MSQHVQSKEEHLDSIDVGDYEYHFYRDPGGQPKGQIRCRRRLKNGLGMSEQRVLFSDLPPPAQRKFLEYAGVKSADELLWGPNSSGAAASARP